MSAPASLDAADFATARAAEARAETLWAGLSSPPPLVLPRAPQSVTRGPTQEALREAARNYPPAGPVRANLALADEAYWRVILRHDGYARTQARGLLRRCVNMDVADVLQIVRYGWFRAALRFDPAAGIRFLTYARRWGVAEVQYSPDRQSALPVPRGVAVADGGWTTAFVMSLETPAGARDTDRLGDTLKDEALAEAAEQLGAAERDAAVRRAVDALPAAARRLVEARFGAEDATLTAIAAEFGLSKQAVHLRERRILRDLRGPLMTIGTAA